MNDLFRKIPKVDDVLRHEQWGHRLAEFPQGPAKDVLRSLLDELRLAIREGAVAEMPSVDEIIAMTARRVAALLSPHLRRVINATGIVIHTNLGRSPLAPCVMDAVASVALNYSNTEYDLKRGTRGDRYEHCLFILRKLTGAEDALVVNNNAAAVLLALNTLADGKEVIISRGELIEIGGSFRIPEVMAKSGARLKEVGTTNRTFIEDYRRAAGDGTGLIMKAHTSNYRIRGFVHEVDSAELEKLGSELGIPFFFDAGSGLLFPFNGGKSFDEPCVADEVKKGVGIVSFSGDKLLGGPQAGVILGRKTLIAAMKQNPLTRALRPDKLTLAALEATLGLYLDTERARSEIPILRMIYQDERVLKRRAGRLAMALAKKEPRCTAKVVKLHSEVGGGTLPDVSLPSYGVALQVDGMSVEDLEMRLRKLDIPIIARIERNRLLLDMRTIREADEHELLARLGSVLADGT
jgi:L-seryl-tRNA(Ser) seleniumtransferase